MPDSAVQAFISKHYQASATGSAFQRVPSEAFKAQVRSFLAQRAGQELVRSQASGTGQLERVEMAEILTNPLLANMRRQVERHPELAKACFYVPKGSLQNKHAQMVPVLVRKNKEADDEASTGLEGSSELTSLKASGSRAISRRSVSDAPKRMKKAGEEVDSAVDTSILDETTRKMLKEEDYNGLVA